MAGTNSTDEDAVEASQLYIDGDPELNITRRYHMEQAATLGVTPEEYVMYLVKKSRIEKQRRAA